MQFQEILPEVVDTKLAALITVLLLIVTGVTSWSAAKNDGKAKKAAEAQEVQDLQKEIENVHREVRQVTKQAIAEATEARTAATEAMNLAEMHRNVAERNVAQASTEVAEKERLLEERNTQLSELREDARLLQRHWFRVTEKIGTIVPSPRAVINIVGPCAATIIAYEKFKLLFLGEVHAEISESVTGPNPMLIWNFFKAVDNQRPMNLFLEMPIDPPKEDESILLYDTGRSGLQQSRFRTINHIERYVADCLSKEKNKCLLSQTTVIPIDPRGAYIKGRKVNFRPENMVGFGYLIDNKDFQNLGKAMFNEQMPEEGSYTPFGLSKRLIEPVFMILNEVKERGLFEKIKKWFGEVMQEVKEEKLTTKDIRNELMNLYAVCKLCLEIEERKANIAYMGRAHIPPIVAFFEKHYFDGTVQKIEGESKEGQVEIQMKHLKGILEAGRSRRV